VILLTRWDETRVRKQASLENGSEVGLMLDTDRHQIQYSIQIVGAIEKVFRGIPIQNRRIASSDFDLRVAVPSCGSNYLSDLPHSNERK